MDFISRVSAHAGRNRELCLSAHGRLPGTLRYYDTMPLPYLVQDIEFREFCSALSTLEKGYSWFYKFTHHSQCNEELYHTAGNFCLEKLFTALMGENFYSVNFFFFFLPGVNDYIEPLTTFTTWEKNFTPWNISVMQWYVYSYRLGNFFFCLAKIFLVIQYYYIMYKN